MTCNRQTRRENEIDKLLFYKPKSAAEFLFAIVLKMQWVSNAPGCTRFRTWRMEYVQYDLLENG
jgi:hypothetical protein